MDTTNTQKWSWIIGTVLGVIIIILIGWLIARHRSASPVVGEMVNATSTATTTADSNTGADTGANAATRAPAETISGAAVSAKDQKPGNTVEIAAVTLPQRGWVAVQDSKGCTLGAALVQAGTSSTTIPLLRNTVAGDAYKVVLYIDNGNGAFDLHGDTLVDGPDGMPVSASFLAK